MLLFYVLVGKSSKRKILHREGLAKLRKNFVPAKYKVKNSSSVNSGKVLIPPLHVKLGLMKDFLRVRKVSKLSFTCAATFHS